MWGNFSPDALDSKGQLVNLYRSVPNEIVALHELGHAKQFIETPALFAAKAHGPLHPILGHIRSKVEQKERSRLGAPDQKALRTMQTVADAEAGIARTKKQDYKKSDELLALEAQNSEADTLYRNWADRPRTTKPVVGGWHLLLESDNIARHEWPVCQEAFGHFVRNNYRGFTSVKMLPPGYILQPPGVGDAK